MQEGTPSSTAPSASASHELPTASAHLTISLRPDVRAQLDAHVPPRFAKILLTVLGQVAVTALLGVTAPILTVPVTVAAGVPAWMTVLVVLAELTAAVAGVMALRYRH